MRQKVLLIDDSPVLEKLVESRLTGEPVELHYACDGESGRALARRVKPDLILLDVDMPGIDGFEVCRRLKLDSELLSIPIIFLTGATATEEKILGLEVGAVDFVAKPFDAADLRARVRSALRLRRMSQLLSVKARVDSVTGLWNEAYFDARLAAEVNLAERSGRPAAVVLCDIDHFKRINSSHGPWFGDDVLRTVADVIAANARAEDVICRVDGATLGIICPSSTVAGVVTMSNRLQSGIAQLRFSRHGTELAVTASFGVAGTEQRSKPAPSAGAGLAGALSLKFAARQALASAKASGRDRICVAEPAALAEGGAKADTTAAATAPTGEHQVERRKPIVPAGPPGESPDVAADTTGPKSKGKNDTKAA